MKAIKDLRWKIEYIEDGIEKSEEGKAKLDHILHISKKVENAIIKSVEGIIDIEIDDSLRFFLNGYQTWTYSKEMNRKGKERGLLGTPSVIVNHYSISLYGDYTFVPYSGKKGCLHGFTYMTIRQGDEFTLLSSLDENYGWTIFYLDANKGEIRIKKDIDNLKYNGEFHIFDLFCEKGKEDEVFSSWFREMNLKIANKPLAGYSSWYNRYQNISEETILEDLKGCEKILKKGDLFQIDDGWEMFVGSWSQDKAKFKSEMKSIVDEIHNRGFLAGLWLAPFVAEEKSDIFKHHKDWLLDINPKIS